MPRQKVTRYVFVLIAATASLWLAACSSSGTAQPAADPSAAPSGLTATSAAPTKPPEPSPTTTIAPLVTPPAPSPSTPPVASATPASIATPTAVPTTTPTPSTGAAASSIPVPPTASPLATPAPSGPPGSVAADAVDGTPASFEAGGLTLTGYLARPKGGGTHPGLIIIHENRGLTAHAEDVARRYANQGYIVFAPDMLARVGGTAKFGASGGATQAINALNREDIVADLTAALAYLKSQPGVIADRVGVIGYCWGGGNSLLFATRSQGLRAAVVYYGPNPTNIDDVANITAPVLGIYGERDTRLTMNVAGLVEAMKKHGKPFDYTVYAGAAHAFFNDTGGQYHAEASALAWVRTNEFLARELKQ